MWITLLLLNELGAWQAPGQKSNLTNDHLFSFISYAHQKSFHAASVPKDCLNN